MRTSTSFRAAAALVLAASAGTLMARQPDDRGARPAAIATDRSHPDLRSCTWLSGRDVVNTNGEEIAEVSDLILDRGSGRIEHAILKTGTILGLGGRQIAIPYRELRWDAAADKLALPMTREQLEQYPEFSADAWTGLREGKDADDRLRGRLQPDAERPADAYAGALEGASRERIEGEVTSVHRTRGTYGEQVEIEVKTAAGETRRVALGPSWFVNGGAAAPMRGDKVTIEAMSLPRDPGGLWVASSLRSGERELVLRESGGAPLWTMKSARSDGHEYGTPYWRYVLLSDIRGQRVDCRGVECGKVDDVILASRSGEIALLSIDPNENFLGIADTKRLVPWSVATVGLDGTVRVDASKEMVLASPETPSDLSTLNTGTFPDQVYRAYDVPPPQLGTGAMHGAEGRGGPGDAWGRRGAILASSDATTQKTVDGKIVEITEVKFDGGAAPARAIKVSTSSGEETVLLGPAWYMDNQELGCRTGDPVKVEARRVTVGGRTFLLARSVDHNGKSVVLIDQSDQPVWDRR
ncbi:MAG: PRC-barrel domain-containing protein [Phycisphaerales bacterium]|nr:PRC-barrel domain-containing protein [Phycisphaerales bacterium]